MIIFIFILILIPLFSIPGTDDDDVIVKSFEAFEINGQIDSEM